jgi:hypothetical protein
LTDEKPARFDEWDPADYLADYFSEVQEDELATIRYFVDQMRGVVPGPVLGFGCGPTLHHIFLTAPRITELYLADYLPRNLEQIDRWRRRAPGAHDWTPFVRYTLMCETGREADNEAVAARTEQIRQGISALVTADAGLTDPLGPAFRGRFAVVLSPYCADSATDDKAVWRRYSRNIATLVRPGGLMLTAALRRCRRYRVGHRSFPSADVDEHHLRSILEQDFSPATIQVDVREVPGHQAQGYTGILLARAQKPGAADPGAGAVGRH